MVLGTTLTSVIMYSKLLVMQNACTVVYVEQGSAKGDYWSVCQASQLTTVGSTCMHRGLLQHPSQWTVNYC